MSINNIGSESPIGIFDSGMGGLTILAKVKEMLPFENIIYYADAKNCPYGGRSASEITRLTCAAVGQLVDMGAKLVVVACNTATAYAIEELRAKYSIPIVAIEPAVKPAAMASPSGRIALLATKGTLEGERLEQLCKTLPATVHIMKVEGKGFVELVEQGLEGTPQADSCVNDVLAPIVAQGVDQIVLGCTHYPFLTSSISKVIKNRNIGIVDPAFAVAARVRDILTKTDSLSKNNRKKNIVFKSSLAGEYDILLENKLKYFHQ